MEKANKDKYLKLSTIILGVILLLAAGVWVFVSLSGLSEKPQTKTEVKIEKGVQAKVMPSNPELTLGKTQEMKILFNTQQTAITAITLRLTYPYDGQEPEVTAHDLQIDQEILANGWSCPVKTITPIEGSVEIDIACLFNDKSGFQTGQDTPLASFRLQGQAIPENNPVELTFDTNQTTVAYATGGSNIPINDLSHATILFAENQDDSQKIQTRESALGAAFRGEVLSSYFDDASPTPTDATTGATLIPTLTPTPTPTPVSTATSSAQLPQSGFSWPTLALLASGLMMIFFASLIII